MNFRNAVARHNEPYDRLAECVKRRLLIVGVVSGAQRKACENNVLSNREIRLKGLAEVTPLRVSRSPKGWQWCFPCLSPPPPRPAVQVLTPMHPPDAALRRKQ